MVLGVIAIAICLFYFRSQNNVVDSLPMTANPKGELTTEWPLFIGIILVFVGGTFYSISTEKH